MKWIKKKKEPKPTPNQLRHQVLKIIMDENIKVRAPKATISLLWDNVLKALPDIPESNEAIEYLVGGEYLEYIYANEQDTIRFFKKGNVAYLSKYFLEEEDKKIRAEQLRRSQIINGRWTSFAAMMSLGFIALTFFKDLRKEKDIGSRKIQTEIQLQRESLQHIESSLREINHSILTPKNDTTTIRLLQNNRR